MYLNDFQLCRFLILKNRLESGGGGGGGRGIEGKTPSPLMVSLADSAMASPIAL